MSEKYFSKIILITEIIGNVTTIRNVSDYINLTTKNGIRNGHALTTLLEGYRLKVNVKLAVQATNYTAITLTTISRV